MSKGFIARIGRAADFFGAVTRASSAVRSGQRPRTADLDRLGIARDSMPFLR